MKRNHKRILISLIALLGLTGMYGAFHTTNIHADNVAKDVAYIKTHKAPDSKLDIENDRDIVRQEIENAKSDGTTINGDNFRNISTSFINRMLAKYHVKVTANTAPKGIKAKYIQHIHKAKISHHKNHHKARKNKVRKYNKRSNRKYNKNTKRTRRPRKSKARKYYNHINVKMFTGTKANYKQGRKSGYRYAKRFLRGSNTNNSTAYSRAIIQLSRMSNGKLFNKAYTNGFINGADRTNQGDGPTAYDSLISLAQQYKTSHYNHKVLNVIRYLAKHDMDGELSTAYGRHHHQYRNIANDMSHLIMFSTL